MEHILSAEQFDRKTIEEIFTVADTFPKSGETPLSGKILASLFYEPSTRTRLSFESAMLRQGGGVISVENANDSSSAIKGETLEDTIRVVHHYADIIVLRHPERGAAARAAAVSQVPVINAGDGAGQHPTQALLDLYTIRHEIGKIDGIRIACVGDLRNGRTVHSLLGLLTHYDDVSVTLISPETLRIGDDIRATLTEHHVMFEEMTAWDGVLEKADVIYQTRIQKERFGSAEEYEKAKGTYVLTQKEAARMKKGAIIMHPLPRVDEIAPEVDALPQAVYFKQAGYGLLVRMALLQRLLG
ncbi:aspartate carbamoyltransferase [Candidatus Kaiserbacteria bacterium]|nr:aspartate carbamoyltransferase [Candidatus Kaiserbacteria bacterium]